MSMWIIRLSRGLGSQTEGYQVRARSIPQARQDEPETKDSGGREPGDPHARGVQQETTKVRDRLVPDVFDYQRTASCHLLPKGAGC